MMPGYARDMLVELIAQVRAAREEAESVPIGERVVPDFDKEQIWAAYYEGRATAFREVEESIQNLLDRRP